MNKSYTGLYGLVEALRRLTGIRLTARSSYDIETQLIYITVVFPDHSFLYFAFSYNDNPIEIFKSQFPEYCI